MNGKARSVLLMVSLFAGATMAARARGADTTPLVRATLRTVEGSVVSVSTTPAEGEIEVVSVGLATTDSRLGRIDILLAPREVLDEIDFAVEPGDSLRARVFVSDAGPVKAHKVLNVSRGTIVRLRTLHAIPLWDAAGRWSGEGPGERAPTSPGHHGRGKGPRR